jgi:hypothetical protein
MLYLHVVLNGPLAESTRQPGSVQAVEPHESAATDSVTLADIAVLPDGLDDLLLHYANATVESCAALARDATTMLVRPVLQVLLAASAPLPVDTLVQVLTFDGMSSHSTVAIRATLVRLQMHSVLVSVDVPGQDVD